MVYKNKFATTEVAGDTLLKFITSTKYRLPRHLICVLALMTFFAVSKVSGEFDGAYDYIEWITSGLLILLTVYINMYILVPVIMYRKKLSIYLLALIGCVLIVSCFFYAISLLVFEKHRIKALDPQNLITARAIIFFFILLPTSMSSTAIKFFQQWAKDSQKNFAMERKTMEIELAALRNQIRPHFLFNMLNTVKIMTTHDPKKATFIIDKLSDFLRYLLYENEGKQIYLSGEIKFLQNYLSLEKLRRDDFEYNIVFSEEKVKGVKLPFNVLLILVENAVKHSADPSDGSYIDIKIETDDKFFCCHISNSIPSQQFAKSTEGGIGLANLKRSLELLFGEGFYLNANKNKDEYIVSLKFHL